MRYPSSEALANQTDNGQMPGFDFYSDPLGAMKPGMTFDDLYKADVQQAEGHDDPAQAPGEPVSPRAQARPGRQDVAGQTSSCGADRQVAGGNGLGSAGRHEPGRDPPQGLVPLQGAASSPHKAAG